MGGRKERERKREGFARYITETLDTLKALRVAKSFRTFKVQWHFYRILRSLIRLETSLEVSATFETHQTEQKSMLVFDSFLSFDLLDHLE